MLLDSRERWPVACFDISHRDRTDWCEDSCIDNILSNTICRQYNADNVVSRPLIRPHFTERCCLFSPSEILGNLTITHSVITWIDSAVHAITIVQFGSIF